MFGSLGNLTALVKRAQELGGQIDQMSRELKQQRATGSAGGGLVQVEVNGLQEVVGCKIDPTLLAQGDAEFLEDLIVTAANQALADAKQLHMQAMSSLTSGLDLGRLKEMAAKLGGSNAPPE
ncbi:MAG TPA: YbaB/EbfC family nucleoid-associated protein [Pirellulales bacterium]|nr:YbaB/EbfC family nucleoid-associated protein [Pirellulales bacterium]